MIERLEVVLGRLKQIVAAAERRAAQLVMPVLVDAPGRAGSTVRGSPGAWQSARRSRGMNAVRSPSRRYGSP